MTKVGARKITGASYCVNQNTSMSEAFFLFLASYESNFKCGLLVVDPSGKYVGLLSGKHFFEHPYPFSNFNEAATECNKNATVIVSDSLTDDRAVSQARKIFESNSSVSAAPAYIPVLDSEKRPLGFLYDADRMISNSVDSNKRAWNDPVLWNQSGGGDLWSEPWGSTEAMWYFSLYPRIVRWLPAGTLLEIAPGYGRCTNYLVRESERYFGVDVSPACVDYCKERFKDRPNASFFQNDGNSFSMIEDRCCDFVFSFDSLVHVEMSTLERYIAECLRILKPGGVAFLDHSDMGEESDPVNSCWFACSVSAETVKDCIRRQGGTALSQERIVWREHENVKKCFSVFTNKGIPDYPCRLIENDLFFLEQKLAKTRIDPYFKLGRDENK